MRNPFQLLSDGRQLFSSRLKRVSGDFIMNILASVIYTFARQIVVFPLLASRLTEGDYGTLLTVTGLTSVCTAMIGNSLNNIRLIEDSRYQEQGLRGDFNVLCLLGSGVSVVFAIVLWRLFSLSALTAILLGAYLIVANFYQYATSFFWLELNTKRILLCNTVVSAAYCAAALTFATAELWPAVFLIGEGTGLLFVSKTTPFLREPLARTVLFSNTAKTLLTYMTTNLIGNFLMYADRMILYPMLGAESVSYYSTAAFFGKSASIVMLPISGVLLGYFAQKDFKASKKLFALVNGCSLLCLAVFLLGCWLFAPWFTRLLYPSLYEGAAPYIFLANLSAAVYVAGHMAQPMVLKACSIRWTLLTQVLYGASYLLLAWLWLPGYGLLGFCWASIASNLVRLLALYAIGFAKF